jgi:tetratricopeptide (TPR) repeat protein
VEAELHMARAAEVAAAYGEPDHRNVSVTQRFAVSLLREQSSETVEEFREVYAANWTYAASVAAHEALAYLEAGEEDRASAAIRRIETEGLWERIAAVYDPDTVSNSKSVLSETVVIGQAAAAVGAHRLTERIVAVVEPYADRCVTVGGAVSFLGAVAHYLGLMTLALGRNDEAQGYFHAALAVYRRLGASGWARLTQRIMAGVSGDDRHNTLRPDGGEWVFSYLGLPARVRDAKGVRDLAVLLSRPGQEVAAVVLMAQGEVAAFGADEVLDAPARAAFRRRLDELDTELADAEANHDLGRSSSVRAEREALAHELASALGLGGRPRGLGDPAERARKAVAARLKDSIERIAAVHPELGRHLRDAVRTGTFCCYSPATPTAWHVTGRRLR